MASRLARAALLFVLPAALLGAPNALAAPDAVAKAQAEALFKEGLTLMKEGKYETACPKLESAVALTEGQGLGGLLQLGKCYEAWGKTASAWGTYVEAKGRAATQKQAAREKEAGDAAARLEPKVPRVRLAVRAPVAGLVVQRDGKEVAATAWATPAPLDPGKHLIEARAPGHKPWKLEVEVAESKSLEVEIPALVPDAAPPPPPPPAPPPPPSSPSVLPPPVVPPPRMESSPWSALRITGVVGMGVGLVGVGLGLAAAIGAKDSYSKAIAEECGGTKVCTENGKRRVDEARGQGDLGTGLFVAGAVVVGAGLILTIAAPSDSRPASADKKAARSLSLAFLPAVGGGGVLLGGGLP